MMYVKSLEDVFKLLWYKLALVSKTALLGSPYTEKNNLACFIGAIFAETIHHLYSWEFGYGNQ